MGDENESVENDPPTQDMKEKFQTLLDSVEHLSKDGTNEEEISAWVEIVRVLCRTREYRNQVRRKIEVWNLLSKFLGDQSLGTDTVITVVSAFGNLVVDDDVEFTACTSACSSGLLVNLKKRAELSIGKSSLAKLQYVICIALTNFTIQLVESSPVTDPSLNGLKEKKKEQESEKEKEKADIVLSEVMNEENSPVPLALLLVRKGENKMTKKSAISLVTRLAEYSLARGQILTSDQYPAFLEDMRNTALSIDENLQMAAISVVGGLFSKVPPSADDLKVLIDSELLSTFASITSGKAKHEKGYPILFDEKPREECIKVLKCLIQRNDELEEDAANQDQVNRSNLLRSCGVIKLALQTLEARVSTKAAIKVAASKQPDKYLIYLTELITDSLRLTQFQEENMQNLLDEKADLTYIRNALLCTAKIDTMLRDAMKRRIRDPKADVDRKEVIIHAQLRKANLYALSQLATSKARCGQLVSREGNEDLFDGKDKLVPLCGHIVASMGTFDLEATNLACNILRNVFISDETRQLALDQLKLSQFGSSMIDLCTNRNQNTCGIAAGIVRFLCSMRSLDLLQEAFPEASMTKALNFDLTKIYPTVRVELARALSYAVSTIAQNAKPSDKLYKLLLTPETISLVSFLLQSNHGVLVLEALDAIKHLPDTLLKSCKAEVKIYLPKDEVDEEDLELTEEDLAEIDKALEQLDNLNINEDDIDLSKLDPNRTKGTLVEEENRKQAEEQEKEKNNQNPLNQEEEVVAISLGQRIGAFANQRVKLEGTGNDAGAVAVVAEEVLQLLENK